MEAKVAAFILIFVLLAICAYLGINPFALIGL
jgi:hypothetical protein